MKFTLVLATVLATAFVCHSAVPSFAAKNIGSHIDSSEFNKGGGTCTVYADYYSNSVSDMRSAKTKAEYAKAREDANWAIGKGYSGGCAWVSGV